MDGEWAEAPNAAADQPSVLIYHPRDALAYARELFARGHHNLLIATDEASFAAQVERAEIVFGWRLPLAHLRGALSLRWIQLMGAGVDGMAESPLWPEGVTLTRVEDQFGGPIAEYVFAWTLYLIKEIDRFRYLQAERAWAPFPGGGLSGRTLAVAGLGSIGREIVRVGAAFGMRTVGLSRSGRSESCVDRHFHPDQWPEFASEADVLVITLPHTRETERVVNRVVFDAMRPSSILINVGRGRVIDEEDLLAALSQEKIRAAVLDVFSEEPLAPDSPFWREPRVYVTPHVSGPSVPGQVAQFFYENLQRYRDGAPLRGVVERVRGY